MFEKHVFSKVFLLRYHTHIFLIQYQKNVIFELEKMFRFSMHLLFTIYKQQVHTQKDAYHFESLGKCKLNKKWLKFKTDNTKWYQGFGAIELPHCWWKRKWVKSLATLYQVKHTKDTEIPILCSPLRQIKAHVHIKLCISSWQFYLLQPKPEKTQVSTRQ